MSEDCMSKSMSFSPSSEEKGVMRLDTVSFNSTTSEESQEYRCFLCFGEQEKIIAQRNFYREQKNVVSFAYHNSNIIALSNPFNRTETIMFDACTCKKLMVLHESKYHPHDEIARTDEGRFLLYRDGDILGFHIDHPEEPLVKLNISNITVNNERFIRKFTKLPTMKIYMGIYGYSYFGKHQFFFVSHAAKEYSIQRRDPDHEQFVREKVKQGKLMEKKFIIPIEGEVSSVNISKKYSNSVYISTHQRKNSLCRIDLEKEEATIFHTFEFTNPFPTHCDILSICHGSEIREFYVYCDHEMHFFDTTISSDSETTSKKVLTNLVSQDKSSPIVDDLKSVNYAVHSPSNHIHEERIESFLIINEKYLFTGNRIGEFCVHEIQVIDDDEKFGNIRLSMIRKYTRREIQQGHYLSSSSSPGIYAMEEEPEDCQPQFVSIQLIEKKKESARLLLVYEHEMRIVDISRLRFDQDISSLDSNERILFVKHQNIFDNVSVCLNHSKENEQILNVPKILLL